MTTTDALQVGDQYTVLHSGLSWLGDIRRRGEVITVTAADRPEAIALVSDPDSQIRRWGSIRLVPGVVAVDPWDVVGDVTWTEHYQRARTEAWAQPPGALRDAALVALREQWGDGPATSRTLSRISGDDQRTKPQPRPERVRF